MHIEKVENEIISKLFLSSIADNQGTKATNDDSKDSTASSFKMVTFRSLADNNGNTESMHNRNDLSEIVEQEVEDETEMLLVDGPSIESIANAANNSQEGFESTFTCTYCKPKKKFGFRYSLMRHLRIIHNPDHPGFSCNGCGRSFVWKSALQRHLRASCSARQATGQAKNVANVDEHPD